MNNIDIQDIYNRLLSNHYYEKLFADLGTLKKEGKELITNCPFCQSKRFSISTIKPVFKCWSCSENGDYIKYLNLRENQDFFEAVTALAREAGMEVNFSSNYQKIYQERSRKLSLFEEVQNLFINSLTPNSQAYKYLIHNRKYKNEIKTMGLGLYPSTHKVKNYLMTKEFNEPEISQAGLLNKRLEGRVSIPYPNQAGSISGFSFRSINDEDKPKYLNSSGMSKDGLVGYQFRPYKPKRVLIVEGLFDALLLNSKGLQDYWILALGGTRLSPKQIKVIEDSGVEEILLCLDNDQAGFKGTQKAIYDLILSKLRVYVFDWQPLNEVAEHKFKDVDQYIREEGLENFILYLNLNCIAWSVWLAKHLSQKYIIGTDLGTDGYVHECLEMESTINDPLEKRLFHDTYMSIVSPFDITEEDLALRKREKLEKTSKGKALKAIAHLRQQLNQFLDQADLNTAELAIEEGLRQLQQSRGVELPSPYLFSDVLEDIAKTGEGLSTGYEDLDQLCLIPRGAITLVAARPSIGKTTFMLNLFLNMVKLYPDKAFYFFSYEESKSKLAVKLIQNLSGEIISSEFNHNAYIRYLKVSRNQGDLNPKIEKGINTYAELVNSGRLWLLDRRLNDLDLVATINLLSSSRHCGGVFIDYIQKIPSSKPSNIDWLNIKNVSQSILDCAVSLDLPIILGCQLNRTSEGMKDKRPQLGALRQSGDLEQDANLVLGLYRDEFYDPETINANIMEVSTLKNRNGSTGNVANLLFSPQCLKISNLAQTNKYSF